MLTAGAEAIICSGRGQADILPDMQPDWKLIMIRIDQIKIEVSEASVSRLESEICRILHINHVPKYEIVKKSIDARKKPKLFYVYSVDVLDTGSGFDISFNNHFVRHWEKSDKMMNFNHILKNTDNGGITKINNK